MHSGIPLITLLGLDLFVSILGLVLFLVYVLEKLRTERLQSNFGYGMEDRVVSYRMENRFQEDRVSGGWNPVLRRRKEGSNIGVQNDGLFTIFVDNIPESMGPKSLYILFNKFGSVKDVFIPAKYKIRFHQIRLLGSKKFGCSKGKWFVG